MSPRFIRYYGYTVMGILALLIVEALCCQHVHAKEKLTYDVIVMNADVAKAVMVYKTDKHRGKKVLKLFGTLETKENWGEIYSLHHKMASVVAANDFPISSSMEFNKNTNKRLYTLQFGPKGIGGSKKINDKKEKPISARTKFPTHDLLSWVNYLRNMEYEVGKPFKLKVFSGNRFYNVDCIVIQIEDVWTRAGIIPAYKIDALVTRRDKRKKKFKKKINVWVSTDERKLPLKMIFKLTLGEIRVILSEVN